MSGREFPKIYLKFEGRKDFNGKKRQYWVQDATEDLFLEIENNIVDNFVGDEPLTKYMKAKEDAVSMQEFRALWHKLLQEKLSLVCLTKDDQNNTKLAGFNILIESKADDKDDYDLKGECSIRLFKILKYIESQRNFYKEFKLQRIIKAMGLYVLQDYRGEGLGERILEAREYLCRNVGITATLTAFTSIISQKLAARVGFEDFCAIEYEELGRIDPGMHIPDIHQHTKALKYMHKLYN